MVAAGATITVTHAHCKLMTTTTNVMCAMQYDAKTPNEYFDLLKADWRKEKLLEIRALIRKHGPELDESIKYGALIFGSAKGDAFGLNAQKSSVNLYVGTASKVDPDRALLTGLNVGKGCIRFSKTKAIGSTRIEEFIVKALGMWRRGEDYGC